MKCFSNVTRTDNWWNQFGMEYVVLDGFMYFWFLPLILIQQIITENLWITKLTMTKKNLDPRNSHEKKIFDPRNTHEKKLRTHDISTRKNFGPTKYPREKISNARNTHEKRPWTNKIPSTKRFGPTRYPRRPDATMTLDPRDPQWHVTHKTVCNF